MEQNIRDFILKYDTDIQTLFLKLRELVQCSTSEPVEEKLWAKLPSYYVGGRFVRLIPFQNHINVEASGLARFRTDFDTYDFTQKGMLQLKPNERIPEETLKAAFQDTFLSKTLSKNA